MLPAKATFCQQYANIDRMLEKQNVGPVPTYYAAVRPAVHKQHLLILNFN